LNPLAAWLLSINIVSLFFNSLDKMLAVHGGFRVPEKVLHLITLLGGSVGGLAVFLLLRHKTRKPGFQFIFWSIVIIQISIIAVWAVIK